jgi:hypothetical protein
MSKTEVLPVGLYGYETQTLTLRKEGKLRVLKRVIGPNKDDIVGDWRKLRNNEFRSVCSCSDAGLARMITSRRMRWAGHVVRSALKSNVNGLLCRRKEITRNTKM